MAEQKFFHIECCFCQQKLTIGRWKCKVLGKAANQYAFQEKCPSCCNDIIFFQWKLSFKDDRRVFSMEEGLEILEEGKRRRTLGKKIAKVKRQMIDLRPNSRMND